jgi:23S rRNA pseudouridine2605 synthase
MLVRLQKYLSDAGVASRRKSEEFIVAGRVSVNGETVTELGTKVDDAQDEVLFDGKPLKKTEQLVYILLHNRKAMSRRRMISLTVRRFWIC